MRHFAWLTLLMAILVCASVDSAAWGQGTTVQLPVVGVSIDADGLLSAREFVDPTGRLRSQNLFAARNLNAAVLQASQLRKVSLRRLENEIIELTKRGAPIPEEMHVLAGLQKIQFIFVLPDSNDIIIAGPAEGWVDDLAGRKVGLTSGLPTLLLEDLLVGLRAFGPDEDLKKWIGVSIDPTVTGIAQLREFQKTIPTKISRRQRLEVMNWVGEGLRESLGMAEIAIYGIPRQSHAAHVLVEADYRMKLMGVGLEAKPIEMTTFIDALRNAPRNMQRWWLTPDYRCLRSAADGLSVEMVGRTVELRTENIEYNKQAQIVQTQIRPSRAAIRYATSFTENYEQLSQVRPIYAQLRNVIDVFVAAAWMKKNNAFTASGWTPSAFLDNTQIDIENRPDAKTVPCVANAVWKGDVLIAPSGGGVSINAINAFDDENVLADKKNRVQKARDQIKIPADRWWWD